MAIFNRKANKLGLLRLTGIIQALSKNEVVEVNDFSLISVLRFIPTFYPARATFLAVDSAGDKYAIKLTAFSDAMDQEVASYSKLKNAGVRAAILSQVGPLDGRSLLDPRICRKAHIACCSGA